MKKFKLFNTEWRIKYIDSFENSKDGGYQVGDTNHVSHVITVAKSANGEKLSERDIKITLLHELVHSILGTGQYNSCNNDEPMVEWIANCLYSLIEQKVLQ